jgi:hypothetical protein
VPAVRSATPPTRKVVVAGCKDPGPSLRASSAPARQATSPSPVASTTVRARTTAGPCRVSTTTPTTREPTTTARVTSAYSSSPAPEEATSSSHTTLSASGSYVTPVPAPYVFGRSNDIPRACRRRHTSHPTPPTTRSAAGPGA